MKAVLLSAAAIIAALAAGVVAARVLNPGRYAARFERAEVGLRRYGPWAVAVISVALIWFVWDQVVPIAKVQDESSYVLQADIFARGRWTVPSPPIPEFFEQPHVLVVPAVASKYPPGHALLLTLGSLGGFHAAVPLLLSGATAALIFALAARLTNPWVALITWLLWVTAPIVLKFQPGYYSEVTTASLMLASWWCLMEWRLARRRRWLLLMALAIGWGAITRPLTMLALAIPIGIVVVRDVVRFRLWKDLGLAFVVGTAVLAVLPLWSAKTTGDWKLWPVELYRRDYMPHDKPGFVADTSPPRRAVSPVVKDLNDYFLWARKQQTVDALPEIVTTRALNLATGFFQAVRLPLVLFAIAGLFFMPAALKFALASAAILFIAYLPYAHWAPWTVYYLETAPVAALLVGVGVWHVMKRLSGDERRALPGMVLITVTLAAYSGTYIEDWRIDHRRRTEFDRNLAQSLRTLDAPAIVFFRYSPRLTNHPSVVFNFADLERAPVWVVHHLGERNDSLRRLAPHRAAYEVEDEQLLIGAPNPFTRLGRPAER